MLRLPALLCTFYEVVHLWAAEHALEKPQAERASTVLTASLEWRYDVGRCCRLRIVHAMMLPMLNRVEI